MQRILIIKLGALGDVVRTLPLLPAIKEKYPDSEITWVTKSNSKELFDNNKFVNNVITLGEDISNEFDLIYNFDIEDEATEIAMNTNAKQKFGFYSEGGYAAPFNESAEYYLNTLFDDELKKSNRKTYQEIMFGTAELPYNREVPEVNLTDDEIAFGNKFLEENNLTNKKIIGLHLGSSPRWPSKAWHIDKIKEFIRRANVEGYKILVFGGPDEKGKYENLSGELSEEGIKIYMNNFDNTIREFTSLLNICDHMICADSFSLHLSLALKKPTTALFFCTPPREIEGYGLLKKITSPRLYEFFPEKMDQYSKELVNSISVEEVLDSITNS
tara:strand:- start:9329 stop:10315 length:987 start_codon:yes stop_codon:yes gene_type:complete